MSCIFWSWDRVLRDSKCLVGEVESLLDSKLFELAYCFRGVILFEGLAIEFNWVEGALSWLKSCSVELSIVIKLELLESGSLTFILRVCNRWCYYLIEFALASLFYQVSLGITELNIYFFSVGEV